MPDHPGGPCPFQRRARVPDRGRRCAGSAHGGRSVPGRMVPQGIAGRGNLAWFSSQEFRRCSVAKSPEDGMASLIRNLEEKTGRSLDAWVAIARGSGVSKHGQVVAFLKKEHGLTHGYANQIALRALRSEEHTSELQSLAYL